MIGSLKIGLLAEGETELGASVPYLKPQDGGKPIEREKEGALHTLIRRELETIGITDCSFIQRYPSTKEKRKGQVRVGYSVGNKKYVQQTVIAWKPSEVDIIIVVLDADDKLEERQTVIDLALVIIRQNQFDENDELILNQSVGGLAIKNFEAWLLSDEEAIVGVLDVSISKTLPQNLEDLPADESSEDFAKNILDKAIAKSAFQSDENRRDLMARWEIAKKINLSEIRARCPNGYVPLFDNLQAVAKDFIAKQAN